MVKSRLALGTPGWVFVCLSPCQKWSHILEMAVDWTFFQTRPEHTTPGHCHNIFIVHVTRKDKLLVQPAFCTVDTGSRFKYGPYSATEAYLYSNSIMSCTYEVDIKKRNKHMGWFDELMYWLQLVTKWGAFLLFGVYVSWSNSPGCFLDSLSCSCFWDNWYDCWSGW